MGLVWDVAATHRLALLIAVLTKCTKLKLYTQDVFVNVTSGLQLKGE